MEKLDRVIIYQKNSSGRPIIISDVNLSKYGNTEVEILTSMYKSDILVLNGVDTLSFKVSEIAGLMITPMIKNTKKFSKKESKQKDPKSLEIGTSNIYKEHLTLENKV